MGFRSQSPRDQPGQAHPFCARYLNVARQSLVAFFDRYRVLDLILLLLPLIDSAAANFCRRAGSTKSKPIEKTVNKANLIELVDLHLMSSHIWIVAFKTVGPRFDIEQVGDAKIELIER